MKKVRLIFSLLLSTTGLGGQNSVLQNPSFERVDSVVRSYKLDKSVLKSQKDTTIKAMTYKTKDWKNCGFQGETPPDVHPTNQFGVKEPAAAGTFYIGMVTRDNGTWESLSQKLSAALRPNTCYAMTVKLMNAPIYQSLSRKTGEPVNYDKAVRLRVWGGHKRCAMQEVLVLSEPIKNREWMGYRFVFQPTTTIQFLRFEAFYTEGSLFYNGNILLDDISEIKPCFCSAK